MKAPPAPETKDEASHVLAEAAGTDKQQAAPMKTHDQRNRIIQNPF
jgi:hypothetical protein